MTPALIVGALTLVAVILGAAVSAADHKRDRPGASKDSAAQERTNTMWNLFGKPAPTPEESAPAQEELAPRPDYGDTYHFENIGVSCGDSEEYIWTPYGPRLNVPPLDPPPSIQKDLYDAKCGAIKLTNPLGETGWQPTIGRIKLWGTDVQHRRDSHSGTIRGIFDGANVPNDAIRYSCWSEERAIEAAEEMKQKLIDKYEERLRTQWVPAE